MNEETYLDGNVTVCPNCATHGRLHYRLIPDGARLLYIDNQGDDHAETFGELRDYTCHNCSANWLIPTSCLED